MCTYSLNHSLYRLFTVHCTMKYIYENMKCTVPLLHSRCIYLYLTTYMLMSLCEMIKFEVGYSHPEESAEE